MDVLTDVLESIHVRSLIVGRLECTAPWGLRMTRGIPGFYVVTRGACWLDVEGIDAPIHLAGGDFVVLPKGQAHVIRDSRRTKPTLASEALKACSNYRACQPGGVFQFGGGGARTTLVGGCFRIDDGESNPLIKSLPPIIHVQADQGAPVEWLEATLQFVASEMAAGRPGAETVVSRLADILFVQAVRAHLVQAGEGATGWLRALVDPQIGQALSLIHEQPHEAWTVERLAERVGMSRSAFAARFGQLVEEPPLKYLTRWRMSKASRLLRRGSSSIGEISGQVGYDAEAAFSKAFKRWHGMSPGMYRRQQTGHAAAPAG
jgi:AraC-like DNA-binding protein